MSENQPISFGLLSDEQQARVNAHVAWKVAQLSPDAKITMADFKRDARDEVCTREGLQKLVEMEHRQAGPFVPKAPTAEAIKSVAELARLRQYLGAGGTERYEFYMGQGDKGKGPKR